MTSYLTLIILQLREQQFFFKEFFVYKRFLICFPDKDQQTKDLELWNSPNKAKELLWFN